MANLKDTLVLGKLTATDSIIADKFKGPLEGNADTATKFKDTKTISFIGGVTGTAETVFDDQTTVIELELTDHYHALEAANTHSVISDWATVKTKIYGDLQKYADDSIDAAIDGLINGASGAYDTLKELEEELKEADGVAAGLAALIGNKVSNANGTMTGNLTISDASNPYVKLNVGTSPSIKTWYLQASGNVLALGGSIGGGQKPLTIGIDGTISAGNGAFVITPSSSSDGKKDYATVTLKTPNGGKLCFTSEASNSGTAIEFYQSNSADSPCRARIRSSASSGAMVWDQSEEESPSLHFDMGKTGQETNRITMPTGKRGTLALLTDTVTAATQFSSAATISLTGDVTGSASSTKGWSIATSLPARLKNYQNKNAITDANNATETGFHHMARTSAGGGNRPPFKDTADDYRILTTAYSAEWLQQIATNYRSNEIFYRRRDNEKTEKWMPWVQIQTTESADARYVNMSGDTMTGPLVFSGGTSASNKSSNYFSAGAGYSKASGLYGCKIVTVNQNDVLMGFGADLTGFNYEHSITTGRATNTTTSYITFATRTSSEEARNDFTTYPYKQLGYFQAAEDSTGTLSVLFKVNGDTETTGHFFGAAHSSSWYNGRDNALLSQTTSIGYAPVVSMKTTNGSWEMSHYNNGSWHDQLLFCYVTDSDYEAAKTHNGYNRATQALKLTKEGNLTLTGTQLKFSSAKFTYNTTDKCIDVTFN